MAEVQGAKKQYLEELSLEKLFIFMKTTSVSLRSFPFKSKIYLLQFWLNWYKDCSVGGGGGKEIKMSENYTPVKTCPQFHNMQTHFLMQLFSRSS